MPLTTNFKETLGRRLQRDPAFRRALLRESIECLIAADLGAGKAGLRDYINGTIGFKELSERANIPKQSLMRMLGPKGNPRAGNLFEVLAELQKAEGITFRLR